VTIDLAADLGAFVRGQITPQMEEWRLQSADSPTTPLTPKDFSDIRKRVLARQRKP